MSLPLPKSLKIGSRRYTVSSCDLSKEPFIGWCRPFSGEIKVEKALPPCYKAEVSLHEVLHALFHIADIQLSHSQEEKVVRALTPHMAAFLADNPAYVKYLLSNLAG